jgi:hypothetical protein
MLQRLIKWNYRHGITGIAEVSVDNVYRMYLELRVGRLFLLTYCTGSYPSGTRGARLGVNKLQLSFDDSSEVRGSRVCLTLQ